MQACGPNSETTHLALRVADSNRETVRAFVGIHPQEATPQTSVDWVQESLAKATGLGEVGLDPRYSALGPGSPQVDVFEGQLEAARRLGKPIQVHSREAEAECLGGLGGFNLKGVLMHWFQREDRLPEVLGRGYFVSFGPALLYSKKLQRMAEKCGPDQALAETDSPVPYAPLGGAHGPSLVPTVVYKLAELWRVSFEEARGAVVENARRYLSAGEKG